MAAVAAAALEAVVPEAAAAVVAAAAPEAVVLEAAAAVVAVETGAVVEAMWAEAA